MAGAAAQYGHLELAQWLCGEGGFAANRSMLLSAASGGNLELVQWLWKDGRGLALHAGVTHQAIHKGHREMLRWARENGCPWYAYDRDKAARELGYTDDFGNLRR